MGDFYNNKIKIIRESFGYTQKQLAALVGADDTSISKYETGDICPSIRTLFRMAELFRVTPEQLMGVKPLQEIKSVKGRLLNIDNGEQVRGELTARGYENTVTLTPDGLRFSTKCVRSWESTEYIDLVVIKEENLLVIRKSEKDDPDSQKWSNSKNEKKYSRKITGRGFARELYRIMNWSLGFSYKISGYIGVNKADTSEELWYFELKRAVASPVMQKARTKMGVTDKEIAKKDLERLSEIEDRKVEEKKEREEIRKNGGNPGPVIKYEYYPDDWGQYTFGLPIKKIKARPLIGL